MSMFHVVEKRCSKCGIEKPVSQFCKCAAKNDGYQSRCKDCNRLSMQKYRESDPQKYREHCNKAYAKKREERIAKTLAARMFNPLKHKARTIIYNAVLSGKVERSEICENCDRERFTQAHHHNYHKPLDVNWLCPPCHSRLHAALQQ